MLLGAPCGADAGREAPNSGFAGQSLRGRLASRVWPEPERRTGAQPLGWRAVAKDERADRGGPASGVERLREVAAADISDEDAAVWIRQQVVSPARVIVRGRDEERPVGVFDEADRRPDVAAGPSPTGLDDGHLPPRCQVGRHGIEVGHSVRPRASCRVGGRWAGATSPVMAAWRRAATRPRGLRWSDFRVCATEVTPSLSRRMAGRGCSPRPLIASRGRSPIPGDIDLGACQFASARTCVVARTLNWRLLPQIWHVAT